MSAAVRDRYLGVIEGRCTSGINGAAWQVATVERLEAKGADRLSALSGMLERYVEGMAANEPVHTWKVPDRPAGGTPAARFRGTFRGACAVASVAAARALSGRRSILSRTSQHLTPLTEER